jgi:hypothetical protein
MKQSSDFKKLRSNTTASYHLAQWTKTWLLLVNAVCITVSFCS